MTLTVLSFAVTQMQAVFFVLSAIYMLDAILGVLILK